MDILNKSYETLPVCKKELLKCYCAKIKLVSLISLKICSKKWVKSDYTKTVTSEFKNTLVLD